MIQVTNPSTLVNGYILSGVAHFIQSTNPITRNNDEPLMVGDKLYRTDRFINTVWTGTNWVNTNYQVRSIGMNTAPSRGNATLEAGTYRFQDWFKEANSFLVESIFVHGWFGLNHSNTVFTQYDFTPFTDIFGGTPMSINTKNLSYGSKFKKSSLNVVVSNANGLICTVTDNNLSMGNGRYTAGLIYREIV